MTLSAFDKYVRAEGAMSPPAESCASLVHPVAATTAPASAAHAGTRSERLRPIRPQALVTGRNPNLNDHRLTSSQMRNTHLGVSLAEALLVCGLYCRCPLRHSVSGGVRGASAEVSGGGGTGGCDSGGG